MRGTCLDRSLSSDLSTLRGIELLGPNGSAKTADWCWEFANQAAIPAVISGPATVASSVPAERQAYAVAAGGAYAVRLERGAAGLPGQRARLRGSRARRQARRARRRVRVLGRRMAQVRRDRHPGTSDPAGVRRLRRQPDDHRARDGDAGLLVPRQRPAVLAGRADVV